MKNLFEEGNAYTTFLLVTTRWATMTKQSDLMVHQSFHFDDINLKTDTHLTALLLEKEPTNMQALSLAELIESKVTQGTVAHLADSRPLNTHFLIEGYIGMAIAGGAAAIGTLLIAGLVRRATRK